MEKVLGINLSSKNILVTYHPVTLEEKMTIIELNEIIRLAQYLTDINFIFTSANIDIGNIYINDKIQKLCETNKNCFFIKSMGQINYFSTLKYINCVMGNSSSGILEVPSFKKGTINIGNRQKR